AMSNLHLTTYLDVDRPQLEQFSVTVQASLTVDSSNAVACAASARLWECLLEEHRLPYLLLRVADMRMTLGSKVTALSLYEELQTMLNDPNLAHWIAQSRSSILAEAQRQLLSYKNNPSLGFSWSQRWRSTIENDHTFPYCKLQRAQIVVIRDQWQNDRGSQEDFLNLHCLETNVIEGTLEFDSPATAKLVKVGFFSETEPVDPIGGAALNEIFTFLKSDPPNLTVEAVCRLHATLMQTSRILYTDMGSGRRLSYVNVGITRQVSCVNVTATLREYGMKIQFCPSDEVEAELATFCKRFNDLVQQPDVDPFASAAWISHVFITIHPFEASFSSVFITLH
ncbi:hypothetical protein M413DRAFT_76580, partial [Hebeloma cylindrosporum]